MGTTDRFDLAYPEGLDEPDGPAQIQALAEDVENWLARAYPVADASARTTLGTALGTGGRGFSVIEIDTGAPYMWTGTTWVSLSGGSGGGGGGGEDGYDGGHFEQTSAQSIPNTTSGPGTVLSLPNGTGSQITRTVEGSGHKFELLASGVWACGAGVRVTSTSTAGEVSAMIRANLPAATGFDTVVAADGGRREGLPRTLEPSRSRYLPAGTTLAVFIYNGTGGTRTLEPDDGEWCNLDLWRVA
jgi:hypothetical protein